MGITALEIKEYRLGRSLFGYNRKDVEALRELCAEALTEAAREIAGLEQRLKDTSARLSEHEQREVILKDTITTAQKMVDDLKNNARREAELIVAEARQQADDITRQARDRVLEIQQEIAQLKKQRVELETSLKSTLEYHLSILAIEEKDSSKKDEETEKLAFFPK